VPGSIAAARLAVLLGAIAALVGCGSGDPAPPTEQTPSGREEVLVTPGDVISAMVALPSGGLLYGERTTGIVRRLEAQGRRMPGVVARVVVSTGGQRGLLGLARDGRGRLFAAWTRPDLRLVVGRLTPGPPRLVWRGPRSSDLGVGGHIDFDTDGSLLIGVGDLQAPGRSLDRSAPNGKLLVLRPDGPPAQRPRVISGGWTNPFAFDVTPAGAVWVADNAVRDLPERLARGDLGFRPARVSALPPATAPSGLAALSERELVVCGYVSRRLQRYRVDGRGRAAPSGPPLATDCALGVVVLADGRLAYARPRSIGFVDSAG
jgi:hypothetical protein